MPGPLITADWKADAQRFSALYGQAVQDIERLEGIIAERDDLIFQLRSDVATLGAQVKQVNIEAGGNTTNNRIFSPGDSAAGDPATEEPGAESQTGGRLWMVGVVVLVVWFLLKRSK